jgi:hypothetical protein
MIETHLHVPHRRAVSGLVADSLLHGIAARAQERQS